MSVLTVALVLVTFAEKLGKFFQREADLKISGDIELLRSIDKLQEFHHQFGDFYSALDFRFGFIRAAGVFIDSQQTIFDNIEIKTY